jgi:magnesium chelatase family protein
MIQKIKTYTNIGLQGHEIIIEADSNRSLPTIDIIGLPDAAIKESKERIRGTFRHCNVDIPAQKIVLNLAPSDIRKEGTRFDLPMAVALLLLCKDTKTKHENMIQKALFF